MLLHKETTIIFVKIYINNNDIKIFVSSKSIQTHYQHAFPVKQPIAFDHLMVYD